MRGAWIPGAAVLLSAVAVSPVTAQTLTSVDPPILGQSIARAAVRLNVSSGSIADGLTVTISNDSFAAAHRGTWAYEFNTSGGLNNAAAVEVVPPTADSYAAFSTLESVINSNPNAPVFAKFVTDFGWFVLVWKYDNEWGINTTAPTGLLVSESGDTTSKVVIAGSSTTSGNFSKINPDAGPVFVQLHGTNLAALADGTSVKLRHQVNTSELYAGVITVKHANAATVSFKTLNVGIGSPLTFPSLGVYNVEINGSPSGQTVTLVENLLDDPTFRVHSSGSSLGFQWFGENLGPGVHWMSNPFPGSDIRDNGDANRQICPRLYPFPTGVAKQVSNDVDNENMSLQWSTNTGVRRTWQTVNVNFSADTTLTLTGLWAATGDHYAMSYGAQLRAGDENGTIIAQTPPGQRVVTPFSWTDFSVSGVFPAATTQITVVFYGEHPTTNKKSLHVDNLLLRVDNEHPAPPGITGMTTPNYAAAGDIAATVTLTGVNLTNGQTSVTLRAPDVMIDDYLSWADTGRKLRGGGSGQNSAAFAAYVFGAGDKFVATSGPNVILGEYEIAAKNDDREITLAGDITGDITGDTSATITGYIVKAPLAASSVNATGTQVTATFNLTGALAGYRNIIVEAGAHDAIVWREGFNVINAGSNLINGSFELPTKPAQNCAEPRIELPSSPASDWNLRFWNNYLDPANSSPMVNFRDDYWNLAMPYPTCPPEERGAHYASAVIYSFEGTAQWSQTLTTTPGATYTLSGYFGHSGEFSVHGTRITLSLLDGDSASAPMAGASAVVLSQALFEDWTFGSVTGTATGDTMTVAWEVECFFFGTNPNSGPRAVWIDHLVLERDLCNDPFADTDDDDDVDQDDFGFFQACFTGSGGSIPPGSSDYCSCLDVEGADGTPDGDIDLPDLSRFEECARGPEVLADPLCGS